MIRFLDLTGQITADDFNFAWYDTITDKILSFAGENVFDSWDHFEEYYLAENVTPHGIERFKILYREVKND